jgi:hypothetical protein
MVSGLADSDAKRKQTSWKTCLDCDAQLGASEVSTCLLVAMLHSTDQLLEEESRSSLREAALTLDKIKQLPCSARQAQGPLITETNRTKFDPFRMQNRASGAYSMTTNRNIV